ncbi:MAG: response regulator [Planctomycetota bacterium]|nr:MAG: response regulator [Planctomycetota bacterium]
MPSPPLFWLIDDTHHWHQVTKASLEHWGAHRFQGFHRAESALMALQGLPAGEEPAVIFMDYYIGADRGDVVTEEIRRHFPHLRCHIVGYSTARSGSEAIARAGGGDTVAKHANADGLNPSLLSWLGRPPSVR